MQPNHREKEKRDGTIFRALQKRELPSDLQKNVNWFLNGFMGLPEAVKADITEAKKVRRWSKIEFFHTRMTPFSFLLLWIYIFIL